MTSRRGAWIAGPAMVCAALLSAGHASASGPSDADRATARALMVEGYARLDRGDAGKAAEAFRAADALVHVPTTAFALARAETARGKLIAAHEALVALQGMPVRSGESPDFSAARAEGAKLRVELETRIPSVRITIDGLRKDAPLVVRLDDEPIPSAALIAPRLVDPGSHTVVAESEGLVKKATVEVAEKSEALAQIVFEAAPPPSALPVATVAPKPAVAEPARGLGAPAWIAITVGIAAVGAGGVSGGLAIGAKNAAVQRGCHDGGCPPPAQSDAHRAMTLGNVSTISFALAGAAALAAVAGVVFLRPRPDAKAHEAPVGFRLGRDGPELTF